MESQYVNAQLEQLHSRYIGTGSPDTSRYEWICNQHRDTYSSYIGHRYLQRYIALAQNECMSKVECDFYQRMACPCGPPPPPSTIDAFIDRYKSGLQNEFTQDMNEYDQISDEDN